MSACDYTEIPAGELRVGDVLARFGRIDYVQADDTGLVLVGSGGIWGGFEADQPVWIVE